jgi:hypothetical protein
MQKGEADVETEEADALGSDDEEESGPKGGGSVD